MASLLPESDRSFADLVERAMAGSVMRLRLSIGLAGVLVAVAVAIGSSSCADPAM